MWRKGVAIKHQITQCYGMCFIVSSFSICWTSSVWCCSFYLLCVGLSLSGLNYCTFRSLFWSLPNLHILAYNCYSFVFTLFSAGVELLNSCRNAEIRIIEFLEQLFLLAVLLSRYNILIQPPKFFISTNKYTTIFFISLFILSQYWLVYVCFSLFIYLFFLLLIRSVQQFSNDYFVVGNRSCEGVL